MTSTFNAFGMFLLSFSPGEPSIRLVGDASQGSLVQPLLNTSDILFLLQSTDAFEDAGDNAGVSGEEKVHVRVQQRNGRKCITTIAGLADDLDIKRICKAFKKNFSCNGAVQNDEEAGEVIQLSGDQRTNVKDFLVDQEICHQESVVLHGF